MIPQFGVDPECFVPHPATQPACGSAQDKPKRAAAQPFRIGSGVGRLVEEKGVDILLRAVAALDGNWRVHLLGSGPAQAQLEALARELGIAARVQFDPPRPSGEMPAYYAQLDLFVLPSRTRRNWKEQFGRALVEAMACAVPVIGSDCGEIPNVIGDAGLIFREEDVVALRAHIAALCDNPAQRAELGQRGRARVLARFTQARVAEETYAVYRRMLDRGII